MAGPPLLPEPLRRAVAADRGAVRPLAPPLRRALAAAVWAAFAVLAVFLLLGFRRDAATLGPLLTWGLPLLQAALGFLLVALALAAAVPGRGAGRGISALALLASLLGLAGGAVLARRASAGLPVSDPWLVHGPACLLLTLLLGASALAVVGVLVARTGPLRAAPAALLAGAGSGVMAEGIFRLHCGITDLRHVLVWHGAAVILLALSGLAAGLVRERREAARMSARLGGGAGGE